MNLDSLDPGILIPAFLAGLLVLSTHVPLGQEVLRRGIIFADLAIAQIAGLGVILAASFGWEAQGLAVQLVAVGAALAGAWLLYLSEQRWPKIQEALIGVLFVLAASGGVLLLSHNPHGGEHLKDLLVGQILWVRPAQLWPVALLSAAVLWLWFGQRARLGRFGDRIDDCMDAGGTTPRMAEVESCREPGPRATPGAVAESRAARHDSRDGGGRAKQDAGAEGGRGGGFGFYFLFAVSVTAAVQLVGVYLVFASLILPALVTRHLKGSKQWLWGYGTGVAGYGLGILASALFDLPTGAITVWMLALAAGVATTIKR
jgi:ABC-type Mn2+/Zn2+ transport system permease subunit